MPDHCHISTSTRLNALFRIFNEDSAPARINNFLYRGMGMSEKLTALGKLPEPVALFLAEMDKKLDVILGQLQKENILQLFPYKATLNSLKAKSAHIKCHEALAPDDCLELVIFLEEFPMQVITCLAQVKEVMHDARGHIVYKTNFIDLDHETEESIIQFLFQEERKRIRAIKNI